MLMKDVKEGMRMRPVEKFRGAPWRGWPSNITVIKITEKGFIYSMDHPWPINPRLGEIVSKDGHEHYGIDGECLFEPIPPEEEEVTVNAIIDAAFIAELTEMTQIEDRAALVGTALVLLSWMMHQKKNQRDIISVGEDSNEVGYIRLCPPGILQTVNLVNESWEETIDKALSNMSELNSQNLTECLKKLGLKIIPF